jgi:hypothetical protein
MKVNNMPGSKLLTIQRSSLFLFSLLGGLLLVYALGFLTNVFVFYAFGDDLLYDFYEAMQKINSGLLFKALVAILFVLLLWALKLARCPAGRYTLCITFVLCAASIYFSIDSIKLILEMRHEYLALDLSVLDRYIERGTISYRASTTVFDLGFAAYGAFAAASLFFALCVFRGAVSGGKS